MTFPPVADLCDAHSTDARVLPGPWRNFTDVEAFSGTAVLMHLSGVDQALKDLLSTPGQGRVAVVSVDRSDIAVFGEGMAAAAEANGWAGVVIAGHVRDVALIRDRSVGVLAYGAAPRITRDGTSGELVSSLAIGGESVQSGDWIIADADGVIALDPALVQAAAA